MYIPGGVNTLYGRDQLNAYFRNISGGKTLLPPLVLKAILDFLIDKEHRSNLNVEEG